MTSLCSCGAPKSRLAHQCRCCFLARQLTSRGTVCPRCGNRKSESATLCRVCRDDENALRTWLFDGPDTFRFRRRRAGLTLGTLAVRVGLRLSEMSAIERGEYGPVDVALMRRLREAIESG